MLSLLSKLSYAIEFEEKHRVKRSAFRVSEVARVALHISIVQSRLLVN